MRALFRAIWELHGLLRELNGLLRELIVSLTKTPALTPRTPPWSSKRADTRVRGANDVLTVTRADLARQQDDADATQRAPWRRGEPSDAGVPSPPTPRGDAWL